MLTEGTGDGAAGLLLRAVAGAARDRVGVVALDRAGLLVDVGRGDVGAGGTGPDERPPAFLGDGAIPLLGLEALKQRDLPLGRGGNPADDVSLLASALNDGACHGEPTVRFDHPGECLRPLDGHGLGLVGEGTSADG